MRRAQIGLFVLGLAAFLASAIFIGQGTGDTLWRTGVAAMLTDGVLMMLYPSPRT